MSLLRLLAAGKSLMGLKDPRSRFQVTDERLLPKFEASKNPFRATTLPLGKAPDRAPGESPESDPAGETPAAGSVQTELAAPPRRAQSLWERAGAKCRNTWPFKTEEKNAAYPPVQTELSLDLVKVVRNDLSDADLPEAAGPKPEGPAMRTLHRSAGAVRALEKSARELLQACKL